jgi:hypothetical protein
LADGGPASQSAKAGHCYGPINALSLSVNLQRPLQGTHDHVMQQLAP